MSKVVASAATELANRTSRRSFLARSSKLLLSVVGGAVVAGVAAEAAFAACNCPPHTGFCSSECPSANCPGDPPRAYTCYPCPNCDTPENQRCCCTGVTC